MFTIPMVGLWHWTVSHIIALSLGRWDFSDPNLSQMGNNKNVEPMPQTTSSVLGTLGIAVVSSETLGMGPWTPWTPWTSMNTARCRDVRPGCFAPWLLFSITAGFHKMNSHISPDEDSNRSKLPPWLSSLNVMARWKTRSFSTDFPAIELITRGSTYI